MRFFVARVNLDIRRGNPEIEGQTVPVGAIRIRTEPPKVNGNTSTELPITAKDKVAAHKIDSPEAQGGQVRRGIHQGFLGRACALSAPGLSILSADTSFSMMICNQVLQLTLGESTRLSAVFLPRHGLVDPRCIFSPDDYRAPLRHVVTFTHL